MRKAIGFMAYDRIDYFKTVLESWKRVVDKESWDVVISLEPSQVFSDIYDLAQDFAKTSGFESVRIIDYPIKRGVLKHPYDLLYNLFTVEGYDYVITAEDDIVVSNDILQFHTWCMHRFKEDSSVVAVNPRSPHDGDPYAVEKFTGFSTWGWGTWKDRWEEFIMPNWDLDYLTGQYDWDAGFDWHFRLRVFPENSLVCVRPLRSKIDHIGILNGTHSDPNKPEFEKHFRSIVPSGEYRYVDSK